MFCFKFVFFLVHLNSEGRIADVVSSTVVLEKPVRADCGHWFKAKITFIHLKYIAPSAVVITQPAVAALNLPQSSL